MKWFVYSNETYYPDATIVEADTAEAARDAILPRVTVRGYHGIAVFPLDSLALWVQGRGELIEEVLRDD